MSRFDDTRTFTAGADLSDKRLVKLSTGSVVHATATATDDPIGVNDFAVASAGNACIRLLSSDDTQEMTAAGAITLNAAVYAAADGKVQALPAGAGTYRQVGIALEAATADGDIIEVLPYGFNLTKTVS